MLSRDFYFLGQAGSMRLTRHMEFMAQWWRLITCLDEDAWCVGENSLIKIRRRNRINCKNYWPKDGDTRRCLTWSFTPKRRKWTSVAEGVGCWRWYQYLERSMAFLANFLRFCECNLRARWLSFDIWQFQFQFHFHFSFGFYRVILRKNWTLHAPTLFYASQFSSTFFVLLFQDKESALCLSPRMFVTFKSKYFIFILRLFSIWIPKRHVYLLSSIWTLKHLILSELRYELFVCISEPHKYQLWVYVYQARDLIAKDESGMNGRICQFANTGDSRISCQSMQNYSQHCVLS